MAYSAALAAMGSAARTTLDCTVCYCGTNHVFVCDVRANGEPPQRSVPCANCAVMSGAATMPELPQAERSAGRALGLLLWMSNVFMQCL